MKTTSLPSKTIIQNRWSNKSLPLQAETKTICDQKTTTTKDSSRDSAQKVKPT
jgi:hypothetical protein